MKNTRQLPIETIERWLKDPDCDVRQAAMNACAGRDVPIEIIERGLKDPDCDVQLAAMNACVGRDVPIETIERWLKDPDWRVRQAAMNACKKNGLPIPITRTIDPPCTVYKKCVASVIVCATILKDAHTRGKNGGKCRASKAVITEVIGDFCGERVGISIFDKTTAYYVGDVVEIDNFNLSNEECSAGFHFFCSKEEAENY